jgi:uncharacterized membrane protein
MDIGTSYGLALSSGINAYLPLLAFAASARWLHLYKINPDFSYITQDWFMILLAILALADVFADKIPGLDHVWDAIHTVIRPIAGALVAAASGGSATGVNVPVNLLAGGVLAGMVHTTKATTRIASTTTTVGLLNIVISVVEDIMMVVGVICSLFLPAVMVVAIVLFIAFFLFMAPRIVRLFRRYRQKSYA